MRRWIALLPIIASVSWITAPVWPAPLAVPRTVGPATSNPGRVRARTGRVLATPQRAIADRCSFGFICGWESWTLENRGPEAVAVSEDGFVYVSAPNEIHKYTNTGTLVCQWEMGGEAPAEFDVPGAIAVDDSGYVYVVDERSQVRKVTDTGVYVTQWDGQRGGPDDLMYPQSLAVDDSGHVFVAHADGRILKFASDGAYLTQWHGHDTGEAEPVGFAGIAADHHGHLYAVDRTNGRIQKFTSVGEYLASWEVPGAAAVAVGVQDGVYVLEVVDYQVVGFDGMGVEVMRWGGWVGGDGQFGDPAAVAVDGGGDVFVADRDRGILRFGTATRWLITATAGPGGSIRPMDDTYVADGMDQSYTVAPNVGYQLSGVCVDGSPIGVLAQYVFDRVRSGHTISASFAPSTAWPSDAMLNLPVCLDSIFQSYPQVVSDGAGGAVIAWTDEFSELGVAAYRIRAQRVDARGVPLWGTGISIDTTNVLEWPEVLLPDEAGGAIILWCKRGEGLDDWHLYLQSIDAEGGRRWGDSGVPVCPNSENQIGADMVLDGAGGVIVVWSNFHSGTSDAIGAQHFNAAGMPMWGDSGVTLRAANSAVSPRVVSDDSAGAIVVWSGSLGLNAQRVDAAGRVRWALGGVPRTSGLLDPSVVSDGAGGIIVAGWEDPTGTGIGGGHCDLYAQRISAGGTALWNGTNGVAVSTAVDDQWESHSVTDGAGGVIVAWYDGYRYYSRIRVQRISDSGTLLWVPEGVPVCVAADQYCYDMAIVPDAAGGAIVAWMDVRRRNARKIYAQRLNSTGSVVWATDGMALCTAAETREFMDVATDGDGGAIAAWVDGRNWDADIYAQSVTHFGALGGPPAAVAPPSEPSRLALEPVRPNPLVNGPLVVRFVLASPAAATVELLDVTGRRLVSRQLGALDPGEHSIVLGVAGRLVPGLYFVRMVAAGETKAAKVAVIH